LQEWHPEEGLLGEVMTIYTGTDLGLTEAPHLFRRGDWYYLTTAEGGTGYDHAVTLARSRDIRGPYETHPQKHLITARFSPDNPIQRMGHGQYVEGHDGRHWHSFLCGRPQQGPRGPFCAMGRETGLAEVVWRDDWLWLKDGVRCRRRWWTCPRDGRCRGWWSTISPGPSCRGNSSGCARRIPNGFSP
jgi:xylan 1,4-beta-xylosidase